MQYIESCSVFALSHVSHSNPYFKNTYYSLNMKFGLESCRVSACMQRWVIMQDYVIMVVFLAWGANNILPDETSRDMSTIV